jgi:hypothetical protein
VGEWRSGGVEEWRSGGVGEQKNNSLSRCPMPNAQCPMPNAHSFTFFISLELLQLLLMLDNGKALTFSCQSSPEKQT